MVDLPHQFYKETDDRLSLKELESLKFFLCFTQHKEPREVHMFVDLFLQEEDSSIQRTLWLLKPSLLENDMQINK
ncbi:hypothetical protein JHK87_001043 [Glycine soja]|nr:hypothetical protein JHK87_001043 [Glycine soja]